MAIESPVNEIDLDLKKYMEVVGDGDYLKTAARLAAFIQRYQEEGYLNSTIVSKSNDFEIQRDEKGQIKSARDHTYVVVKAEVDTGTGRKATSHRLGVKRFDAEFEKKADTGAIGRVLRLIGFNSFEVQKRLVEGIDVANMGELLGDIKKGANTFPYLDFDARLFLFLQKYPQFSIMTKIEDIDMTKEFAKETKINGKQTWIVAYGHASIQAIISVPSADGKRWIERNTTTYSNALDLSGVHWFAANETAAINRTFIKHGIGTLQAQELKEKPEDISDGPVVEGKIYTSVLPAGGEAQVITEQPAQRQIAAPRVQTPAPRQPQVSPAPSAPAQQEQVVPQERPPQEIIKECQAMIKEVKALLSDQEYYAMCVMRIQIDPVLAQKPNTWGLENWQNAYAIATQCKDWKQLVNAPTPEQDERYQGHRTFHGGQAIGKFALQFFPGKQELKEFNRLEFEYLLIRLDEYDLFCKLARNIDPPRGNKPYPQLNDSFKMGSPLEFEFDPTHRADYAHYLYNNMGILDDEFWQRFDKNAAIALLQSYKDKNVA